MKIRNILAVVAMGLVLPTQAKTLSDSTNVQSIVDEVIWVVGDEAILKSDVESMRLQAQQEGVRWNGDPDCAIPEQLAVQKLYLNQAAIDSIEVTEADIAAGIEQQIEYMISVIGSREKLEEYHKKTMNQIRSTLRESYRDRQMIQETEVEVQILTLTPRVEQEEINRVKDELRDYTDRVNKGETSFQTLARMYSEDPGTARRGGELGFTGRATLDPAFANVAFNLTDPKKVSKIVESEFGFHIIQLIDKRGDKVNVRHILRKPIVSQDAIDKSLARLDTVATAIRDGVPPEMIKSIYKDKEGRAIETFTFEDAVTLFSDDKDTRNNKGLMANVTQNGRTSRFQLQDLPPEVARVVDNLKVGEISAPFQMINERGKTVCAIAKLKSRTEGHKATITEDFQVMKDVVLNKRRQEVLHEWVVNKIKSTYVHVNDRYKDCQFEYQGWIK